MASSRFLLKTNKKKEAFSAAFTIVEAPSNTKARSSRRRRVKDRSAASSATASTEHTPIKEKTDDFKPTKILQRPKKSVSPKNGKPTSTMPADANNGHAQISNAAISGHVGLMSTAVIKRQNQGQILMHTEPQRPGLQAQSLTPSMEYNNSATPLQMSRRRQLKEKHKRQKLAMELAIDSPTTPPFTSWGQKQKGLTPNSARGHHRTKVRKTPKQKHTYSKQELEKKMEFLRMLDELDTDGIFNQMVHKPRDYAFPSDATLFSSFLWDSTIQHYDDSWQPDRVMTMQRIFGKIVVNPHSRKRFQHAQISM